MNNLAIFCADVGSVRAKKFGWAAKLPDQNDFVEGENSCIASFAQHIANSIEANHKVTIGFECPLFVPIRTNPIKVNSARHGEGNRSWSAGAGTAAMATGLVEVLWVMNTINSHLESIPQAQLCWHTFKSNGGVFLWEAFVSGKAKGSTHAEDAEIAIDRFMAALPNVDTANAIDETNVLSLVGAAALRTGWSHNIDILATPCLVIRA